MHSFEYILLMLLAVLLSSLLSQQFPRLSTPLVQIALGIGLALGVSVIPGFDFHTELDPELFMVLFLAPLLFEDAKKADKSVLWRFRRPILLLAIGLVFATCLVVGFSIHAISPAIPLSVALALAAALAPTDAVAVISLKSSTSIDEDHRALLQGEALFNDASSIVSFQFAVAAMLAGGFSVIDDGTTMVVTVLFMFIGGVVVGVVLMLLRYGFVQFLHATGVESVTFHVMFEVVTPFLIFLVAEMSGVSGIIAVVAAGITYSLSPRRSTPDNARHKIVSTSVWSVISFTLNGLVFLILGTQLPGLISSVWSNSSAHHEVLLFLIVFIFIAIMAIRFLWVLAMRAHQSSLKTPRDHIHDALVMSLGGVKGAVSLALLLTIPMTLNDMVTPFPERDLALFLASGVIVLSLLVSTFLMPLVAPRKDDAVTPASELLATMDIYRSVVHNLLEHITPQTRLATDEVVKQYSNRLTALKRNNGISDPVEAGMRRRMIDWERENTLKLIDEGKVDFVVGSIFLYQLGRLLARVEHHNEVGWIVGGVWNQLWHRLRFLHRYRRLQREQKRDNQQQPQSDGEKRGLLSRRRIIQELRELQHENYRLILRRLDTLMAEPNAPIKTINFIVSDVQRRVTRFSGRRPVPSTAARDAIEKQVFEIEASALQFEREAIDKALEHGRISRHTAKQLRDNVAIMELDIEDDLA